MVTTAILVGGGEIYDHDVKIARALRGQVVCADGGLFNAVELGLTADMIVGDLDSLNREQVGTAPIQQIADQNRTDFQKALSQVEDKRSYCFGFWGKRLDHSLASLTALAGHPAGKALLFTDQDICLLAPRKLSLDLQKDDAIAFYPLSPSRAKSSGLAYPLDGLDLSSTGRIGTSNQATGHVHLHEVEGHLLVIVPRDKLDVIEAALD